MQKVEKCAVLIGFGRVCVQQGSGHQVSIKAAVHKGNRHSKGRARPRRANTHRGGPPAWACDAPKALRLLEWGHTTHWI
eukprot:scaffold705_cov402-Prasinococcus_capsulatus_cf.AAC.12